MKAVDRVALRCGIAALAGITMMVAGFGARNQLAIDVLMCSGIALFSFAFLWLLFGPIPADRKR